LGSASPAKPTLRRRDPSSMISVSSSARRPAGLEKADVESGLRSGVEGEAGFEVDEAGLDAVPVVLILVTDLCGSAAVESIVDVVAMAIGSLSCHHYCYS
jgi:hypothetical protein